VTGGVDPLGIVGWRRRPWDVLKSERSVGEKTVGKRIVVPDSSLIGVYRLTSIPRSAIS
jgi:hypothetical protein